MPRRKQPKPAADLSAPRARGLGALARRLGHSFEDLRLLDRALSHASLANSGCPNYERLEFLGDAVLGFLVADHLYDREPEIPEGQLTDWRARLVSREPLARIAEDLGLCDHLLAGRGLREQDRQSPRIRADLVEAVLGAIYLDGGLRAARKFVRGQILKRLRDARPSEASSRDPKSRLLHWAQSHQLGQPSYDVLEVSGPEHAREFRVAVSLRKRPLAEGCGRTKQAAEKMAAERGLAILQDEQATA
jgi:ribonuclease-3